MSAFPEGPTAKNNDKASTALTKLLELFSNAIDADGNLRITGQSIAFTDLKDTPKSYAGRSLAVLRVNVSETGVETIAIADIALTAAQMGIAGGLATLDPGTGKIPLSQLPTGLFEYKGTWNPNTNTPELVDGTGNAGDVYWASAKGSHDFGHGVIHFEVDDWVAYGGQSGHWERMRAGASTLVTIAADAPGAPEVGMMWFDSTNSKLKVWTGASMDVLSDDFTADTLKSDWAWLPSATGFESATLTHTSETPIVGSMNAANSDGSWAYLVEDFSTKTEFDIRTKITSTSGTWAGLGILNSTLGLAYASRLVITSGTSYSIQSAIHGQVATGTIPAGSYLRITYAAGQLRYLTSTDGIAWTLLYTNTDSYMVGATGVGAITNAGFAIYNGSITVSEWLVNPVGSGWTVGSLEITDVNGLASALSTISTTLSGIATTLSNLGSAATHDASDFATAAQGSKADSALQSQTQADWNEAGTTLPAYIKNKPTLFSGSYTDLTNKPTLFSGSYTDLTNKPTLFSGSYNDLTDKPTIPSGQIQSDWNQASTSAPDFIKNKPSLFSGAYADLTGKPSLFSGAYADLTGKPSLFSGAYADLTGKPTLFSGSYTDLTDKPTIPAAQIQSDWTQSNNTLLDYVKNKPTLGSAASAATTDFWPAVGVWQTKLGVSYTLAASDNTSGIDCSNVSSFTLTIPSQANVPIAVGFAVQLRQGNTGGVTVAPDTGVTINTPGGVYTLSTQYTGGWITKIGTNTWWLVLENQQQSQADWNQADWNQASTSAPDFIKNKPTIVNTLNGNSGAMTVAAGSNVTIVPSGNTLTISSTGTPVSAVGAAYGCLYLADNTTTQALTTQNTFYTWTTAWVGGISSNATLNTGAGSITLTQAGIYQINLSASIVYSGGSNQTLEVAVFKNGAYTASLSAHVTMDGSGAADAVVISGLLSAAANDVITVAIQNTTSSGKSVYLNEASLSVSNVSNGILVPGINSTASTGYTATLSDMFNFIYMTASTANTMTIPPNVYPVGTILCGFQAGTGQTTLTAGAGVTLQGSSTYKTNARYSGWFAIQIVANTWLCGGAIS